MHDTSPNGTWQSWFDTYGRRLVLFARQWAEGGADAEDIVQEAFVRFWRSPWRNDADAVPQLFAMVRRAGLDAVRRRSRRERREQLAVLDSGDEPWLLPATTGDDGPERHDELQTALSGLPDEQREVVVLKLWGELTFDQIGRSLDISPNTAASRYRYALEALRRSLLPSPP
jgi:RNA polymerase sigma-70 factor (ECF subfamily)